MKKDKKELIKGVKTYNMIMSNVWQLITILIIGVLLGYLLEKNATNPDINYMLVSVIGSIIIGITVFFVGLIKGLKKIDNMDKEKAKSNNDDQFLA